MSTLEAPTVLEVTGAGVGGLGKSGLEFINSRMLGLETQQGLGSFLPELCATDLEAERGMRKKASPYKTLITGL